jgi:hypothetical protein
MLPATRLDPALLLLFLFLEYLGAGFDLSSGDGVGAGLSTSLRSSFPLLAPDLMVAWSFYLFSFFLTG